MVEGDYIGYGVGAVGILAAIGRVDSGIGRHGADR